MIIGWEQAPEHLLMAEEAIGVKFRGQPTYWLSVEDAGKVKAVVVYCGFTACSCEISVAVFGPQPFTRKILQTLFAYPLQQLGLKRLHAFTRSDTRQASDQLARLGFKIEGLLRDWYPDCHGIMHGLLKEECKWL